jgi:hypothetical protein
VTSVLFVFRSTEKSSKFKVSKLVGVPRRARDFGMAGGKSSGMNRPSRVKREIATARHSNDASPTLLKPASIQGNRGSLAALGTSGWLVEEVLG